MLTLTPGSNLTIIAPITLVVVGALFFTIPHIYLFRACTSIDNILDFDKSFSVNGNVKPIVHANVSCQAKGNCYNITHNLPDIWPMLDIAHSMLQL